MGTIEEGYCHDDLDCSNKQYCYPVSRQCVNYTVCQRYNRKESQKPARNPSQCGPCTPGYAAERLATGEEASLCKKTSIHENMPGVGRNTFIISASIAAFLLVVILSAVFYKKRAARQRNYNKEMCGDTMEPSAPPVEASPFIDHQKSLPYILYNNNKNVKDKNTLVHAGLLKPPNWVQCHPNYENNLNNNNDNTNTLEHSRLETPSTNDSNTWITQHTQEIVNAEQSSEQMDNSANANIVQMNNSSSDDSNNTTTNNSYTNNSYTNNTNSSASGSSNTRDGRERSRRSNILIAQINLNVRNGDC